MISGGGGGVIVLANTDEVLRRIVDDFSNRVKQANCGAYDPSRYSQNTYDTSGKQIDNRGRGLLGSGQKLFGPFQALQMLLKLESMFSHRR